MLRSLPLAFTFLLVICAGALAQPLPMAKPESVGVTSRQLAQIAIAMQREIDTLVYPALMK